jgi:hypothetical protein
MATDVGRVRSVGYFTEAGQTVPTVDPGICAVCGKNIGAEPKLYRSLMLAAGGRSYFFSYHKTCRDEDALNRIEGEVVDTISAWEQPQ